MNEIKEFYFEWIKTQPKQIYIGGRSSGKNWNVMLKFAEAYHEHKLKLENEQGIVTKEGV